MKPPNGYFAHHRMILKFVGLDLSFDKNKKWKSVYLMWFSLIISVNIVTVVQCTLATVLYTNNELVERSFVVLCGATVLEAVLLFVYLYLRKEKLQYILDKADRTFKYKSETTIDKIDMDAGIIQSKILMKWSSVTYFVGIHFMGLLPLLSILSERKLSVVLWYPFDWRLSPFYEIAIGMNQIELYCATMAIFSIGTVISGISVITRRQFEIIGSDLENCVYTALLKYGFSETVVRNFRKILMHHNSECKRKTRNSSELILIEKAINTNKFKKVLNNIFVTCVKHHENLSSFCNDLEDFFSPLLLSTEKDKSFQTGLIMYITIGVFQLFICTFFGQIITNASSELKNKLYKCPWYLCDANFRKNFAFAHLRCGRPVNLTAGKLLDLNFESFIKFLKVVFSYAAVLKQVTDRASD